MTDSKDYRDLTFTARDGLKLYGRHYPARVQRRNRPVLCLPGLTRNSRDFEPVAVALSQSASASRDVFTIDYRGRGLSEHDRDWRNYAVPVETHDVIDFMTMAGLFNAGIIGTSRGGLIAMLLAAAQPTRLGAVVLNDIGPVVETDGLLRIAGYVGRTPLPKSWKDAGGIVGDLMRRDFPELTEEESEIIARQLFNERDGRPAPGYDNKLSNSLSVLDGPMPKLWPRFEALKRVPVLVVRGANSDLLSKATVEEMQRRHPRLFNIEVKGQGHAPLLADEPTVSRIEQFFSETDGEYARLSHAA